MVVVAAKVAVEMEEKVEKVARAAAAALDCTTKREDVSQCHIQMLHACTDALVVVTS